MHCKLSTLSIKHALFSSNYFGCALFKRSNNKNGPTNIYKFISTWNRTKKRKQEMERIFKLLSNKLTLSLPQVLLSNCESSRIQVKPETSFYKAV